MVAQQNDDQNKSSSSNHIKNRMMTGLSKFLFILGIFALLVGLTAQERVLEALEERLAYHMIFEHALFFTIGSLSVIFAEASLRLLWLLRKIKGNNNNSGIKGLIGNSGFYWAGFTRFIFGINKHHLVWPAIAIVLLTFWHIPSIFDLATSVENIHILQHFSFIIVGSAGFLAMRILGDSFKIFVLIAIMGMMGFSGLLFSVLDAQVFSVYSIGDHNEAGTYMIITSTLLLVIGLPLYLIQRTLFHVKTAITTRDSNSDSNNNNMRTS